MLVLVIEMVNIGFLLQISSEENWDDQKLKILGIVVTISLLSGFAAISATAYAVASPALAAYFLVGTLSA